MAGLHFTKRKEPAEGTALPQRACLKRVAWRNGLPPSLCFLASHRHQVAVTGQNSCSRGPNSRRIATFQTTFTTLPTRKLQHHIDTLRLLEIDRYVQWKQ